MTAFIINGPGAAPASQLKRFLALQQILSGFSEGIDGDRLQAAFAWAMDGKSNYQRQHLISLFAAPWVAAQEEAGWQGDAFLQGEKDLNEITAVALQSDPVEDFLDQVRAELARARSKFPGDRIMTLAMAEEFGELVKAVLDEPSSDVRKEAVQTAAMAARVVLDGDASVNDWRAAKGLDPLTGGVAALTPGTPLRHRDGRTGTFVSLEEDGRYRVRSLMGPGFWIFHPADCSPGRWEPAPPKGSEAANG
ncbi:hypothetical protein [Brevundimonas sp.]|uniref:hypothetical protein n=1 Tax=Brevundimonas sp. TaxID=1871086 RepID=UPI00289E84D2|nr:hypothetical protein [Brevundimonas sp.]